MKPLAWLCYYYGGIKAKIKMKTKLNKSLSILVAGWRPVVLIMVVVMITVGSSVGGVRYVRAQSLQDQIDELKNRMLRTRTMLKSCKISQLAIKML